MKATSMGTKAIYRWLPILPALLLAAPVMAQSSDTGLAEVVVTAQKREENLQKATVAITAVKGAEIENLGVTDPDDLQSQMPGVQFMNSGLTNTTIRGVGTYNNQPNVDAAVAWNIDGTYISHQEATPPILFDLERVEVVRGPLGTLYGRNSNGGSINVITGRPSLGGFAFKASVGTGNYDQRTTEFMVNIPVNDTLAVRAAFASDYSVGYFQDGGEGKNNYAGRLRLLYMPSDRFNLLATLEWSSVRGTNEGLSYCPPWVRQQQPACQSVAWVPYQGFGFPGNFDKYGTAGPIGDNPGFLHRDNLSAYAEWSYQWDQVQLTSISNYHKYNREELHVWDFSSYSPKHFNKFITQELRLAPAGKSPIGWVAGLYYSRENSDGIERFGAQLPPDYQTFQTASYYGVQGGKVTSAAAFGQVTYPILEQFRLKGGIRYTYEKKDLPGSAGANVNTPDPILIKTGSVLTTKKPTWEVGAEYDVASENLLYVKVNTGFKSGTVNAVPPGIGVPTATEPETITAYQIGSKNRFLDNLIEVNAEFFYYDYKGYQVVIIATDPTGFFPGVFFPSVNSQKARFEGGEIESHFKVTRYDQFDLALTLLDAKHLKFVTPLFDYSGHRVERSPPYTVMAGYSHELPLPNGASLTGRITTNFVAGNYTQDANQPGDWQESYTNTSAYLVYRVPGDHWSLTGWVRNLENRAVMNVSQGSISRPGWNIFMNPPRFYGFSIKYEM